MRIIEWNASQIAVLQKMCSLFIANPTNYIYGVVRANFNADVNHMESRSHLGYMTN